MSSPILIALLASNLQEMIGTSLWLHYLNSPSQKNNYPSHVVKPLGAGAWDLAIFQTSGVRGCQHEDALQQ